jgi:hypothetical protein
MDDTPYNEIPIYMVCSPAMAWPGVEIHKIFFEKAEAERYINEMGWSPFSWYYIKEHFVSVSSARDTSTE